MLQNFHLLKIFQKIKIFVTISVSSLYKQFHFIYNIFFIWTGKNDSLQHFILIHTLYFLGVTVYSRLTN